MTKSSSDIPQSDSRFSGSARLNSGLRFVGWHCLLIVGFLIIIPEFKDMFEEFELKLPALTELAISFSNRAIKSLLVFVPLAILIPITAELGLMSIPRGTLRRSLNAIAWLVLLVSFLLCTVAVFLPLNAISNAIGE